MEEKSPDWTYTQAMKWLTFLIFNIAFSMSTCFAQLPSKVESLINLKESKIIFAEQNRSFQKINMAIHDVSFFGHKIILDEDLRLKEETSALSLISPHGVSVAQILQQTQVPYQEKIQLLTKGIYLEDFKEALSLWRKHGVKLVNLSMTIRNKEIVDLLNDFINEGGIVIASSGNSAQRFGRKLLPHYKNFQGMTVSACDLNGDLESFSQWEEGSILAPGSLDLYPVKRLAYHIAPREEPESLNNNLYLKEHFFGMTSAATPVVAGVVAMALRINPKLRQSQINDLIRLSGRKNKANQLVFDAEAFLREVLKSI